jgi:diguanylate cyclase (GGDEF)-like protein
MNATRIGTRGSGWHFPARTTAVYLVVAGISMTVLAFAGLQQFRALNQDNIEVRIDRAARAADALLQTVEGDFIVDDGDPARSERIVFDSIEPLQPGERWDTFVDVVSNANQGAASVFRFESTAETFDRISTSFKTPDGERAGDSQIEHGLIAAGHPAFDSISTGTRFVGEVPVAGRMRFASLTPIVDTESSVIGALAVDVGFVDDLNRINGETNGAAWTTTITLLIMLLAAGTVVMFLAFKPLNRLIRIAQELGAGQIPTDVPLTDRRGEIGQLATALSQVVDLHADLATRAFHDQLTGLPNRAHFLDELEKRIAAIDEKSDDDFALLLIDLDQFKEVNDGLGHAAGDELLGELSIALAKTCRQGEFLARLGGDEFALITGPITCEVDADQVASRVSDSISSVTRTSVADIVVTGSIGIVMLPQQADTAETALSHADLALYRAKRAGRAHWQFYESTLAAPVQRRVRLSTELRRAIDRDEIRLEYQPMFDVAGTGLGGFEALSRWDHPIEGAIPPSEFITVAENAGLINELGNSAIEQTCEQSAVWRDLGFDVPTISVNVSTIQLWQRDFLERIESSLNRHGLGPETLCLEITESIIVHHADGRSREILHQLSEMGVRLSVDDFGTGYSSLSYLRNLKVHQVKIDRTFVTGAEPNTNADRLFGGIASLGRQLGLQVVAEGVETESELDLARRHGCTFAQGFLLSHPLRPQDATHLFMIADERSEATTILSSASI